MLEAYVKIPSKHYLAAKILANSRNDRPQAKDNEIGLFVHRGITNGLRRAQKIPKILYWITRTVWRCGYSILS